MNYAKAEERWVSVGPYYAMFPTTFVDRVIDRYTNRKDQILDPFAGRSTSIFLGALNGRPSIGIEISPVGWIYGKTKLSPARGTAVVKRLDEIAELAHDLPENAGDNLPEFYSYCFSRESIRFLLTARAHLDWRHKKVDRTLMTLILIDLHGVRGRSFSNQMRQSRAMSPDYSISWWRARGLTPPEINPQEFLKKKIKWRYAKGVPEITNGSVWLGDSTTLMRHVTNNVSNGRLKRIKLLFTSPPYMEISDYHRDQWLRLWLLGGEPLPHRNQEQYRNNFSSPPKYRQLLASVFGQASEVMSQYGYVYVRTDAREQTFEITHDVLREYFPHWSERVIKRPFGRQTQTALYGDKSLKPGERDIVLTGPRA
jgi:hypothetical protein